MLFSGLGLLLERVRVAWRLVQHVDVDVRGCSSE